MTDPTPERIAAALRLASVLDEEWATTNSRSTFEVINEALRAYRATLPKLRTRSERDADLVTACERAVQTRKLDTGFFRECVQKPCAEPTAEP